MNKYLKRAYIGTFGWKQFSQWLDISDVISKILEGKQLRWRNILYFKSYMQKSPKIFFFEKFHNHRDFLSLNLIRKFWNLHQNSKRKSTDGLNKHWVISRLSSPQVENIIDKFFFRVKINLFHKNGIFLTYFSMFFRVEQ